MGGAGEEFARILRPGLVGVRNAWEFCKNFATRSEPWKISRKNRENGRLQFCEHLAKTSRFAQHFRKIFAKWPQNCCKRVAPPPPPAKSLSPPVPPAQPPPQPPPPFLMDRPVNTLRPLSPPPISGVQLRQPLTSLHPDKCASAGLQVLLLNFGIFCDVCNMFAFPFA